MSWYMSSLLFLKLACKMDRDDDLSDFFMCREYPVFENKDLFSIAKVSLTGPFLGWRCINAQVDTPKL